MSEETTKSNTGSEKISEGYQPQKDTEKGYQPQASQKPEGQNPPQGGSNVSKAENSDNSKGKE